MSDNKQENLELNRILEKIVAHRSTSTYSEEKTACCGEPDSDEEELKGKLVQWSSGDGKTYFPAGETIKIIPPGVYEIGHCERGIFFQKIPTKTEGLIRFPQTNSDKVLTEIQNFWQKEERFREYSLTYKRGIILWGPPGSGKSCTIQLIIEDVVQRNGIVIKFTHPNIFLHGMRCFKEIQPNTPMVVLMEDIDAILEMYSESSVLNILDGVDEVDKVVFLATTNYPERLGARILNRPSRFDKRFKIGHPNEESRKLYLKHIIGEKKIEGMNVDLEKWVADTEGFSIAHLKELFVAVCILGDDYDSAITTLESMKEQISPEDEFERPEVGFAVSRKKASNSPATYR